MTTRSTADAIRAKIKAALANKEKFDQEVVELERQQAWEAGQARRDQLAAIGADAEQLAEGPAATDLGAALNDVTNAVRKALQLADQHTRP